MIAALATLAFLATMWLLVVVTAATLQQSGGKIRAALKGQSIQVPVQTATFRIRYPLRSTARAKVIRATPRLRAAA